MMIGVDVLLNISSTIDQKWLYFSSGSAAFQSWSEVNMKSMEGLLPSQ